MADPIEYITAAFVAFFGLAVLAMTWAALYPTNFTVAQVADFVTVLAVPFTLLLVFLFFAIAILQNISQ